MKKRKFTWKPEYKYLFALGVFLCLCLINSSYSFYKESKENKDAIYLAGVTLNYTITSEDLEDNQLILEGNSKTEITIQVTSHNTKDTQYKVYYQILKTLTEEQRANIRIETIRINTVDLPTGSISPSETKTIVIELENKNDTPVTIDLGVQGGLIDREIILEEGNSIKVIEGTRTI